MDGIDQPHEQAVFDDARQAGQSVGQCCGRRDVAERAVEHEISVVGDNGAVLALGPPEFGVPTQFPNRLGDSRSRRR